MGVELRTGASQWPGYREKVFTGLIMKLRIAVEAATTLEEAKATTLATLEEAKATTLATLEEAKDTTLATLEDIAVQPRRAAIRCKIVINVRPAQTVALTSQWLTA